MATTNTVITRADELRENTLSDENKAIWINQVEQTVQRDILKLAEPVHFKYPDDVDKELSLTDEWSEIYVYYVVAMIDYWYRDTNLYNISAKMYNDTFQEYRKQYRREHPGRRTHFTGLL